jgi:hypothetical protein
MRSIGHVRVARLRDGCPTGEGRCGTLVTRAINTTNWPDKTVGISFRRFLIGSDDGLYRLASAKFNRMIREPSSAPLPLFAGQRAFAILEFDHQGELDFGKFEKQQFALASSAMDAALAVPDPDNKIVNAVNRFVAHGGSWTPTYSMKRRIEHAVFGKLACRSI